jgi:hypothetical protein
MQKYIHDVYNLLHETTQEIISINKVVYVIAGILIIQTWLVLSAVKEVTKSVNDLAVVMYRK